jgi:hypothetical protein
LVISGIREPRARLGQDRLAGFKRIELRKLCRRPCMMRLVGQKGNNRPGINEIFSLAREIIAATTSDIALAIGGFQIFLPAEGIFLI